MVEFHPSPPSRAEDYQHSFWVRDECYRFYAEQRRRFCALDELLDLWLQAPCCADCIGSTRHGHVPLPDIAGDGWQVDVLIHLGGGPNLIEVTENCLAEDPDYAFACKKCHAPLRPWNEDHVWVLNYHLESHYGIPLETPGKKRPSKELNKRILRLYDSRCFNCGTTKGLHLDHIQPRASGGTAAFRNLQPLCEPCGQRKGAAEPVEIQIFNPLYFMPSPPDSWEGLFW